MRRAVWAVVAAAALAFAVARAADDPFLERIWLQYNFVPGDRIVFAEDFASADSTAVLARFDGAAGAARVESWSGERVLRVERSAALAVGMNEALAPNFTIEFDLGLSKGAIELASAGAEGDDASRSRVRWTESSGALLLGDGTTKGGSFAPAAEPHHVSLMVEGSRARLWVDGAELCDVPNSNIARTNLLRFQINPGGGDPIRLGALRIATISRPLLAARLKVEPTVIVHGLTWSGDALRPESAPTLRWLVDALRQDQALRLRLTVHADGAEGAGSALFATVRRAKNLEAYLRSRGGIGPQQVTVEGKGNQHPQLAPNTPEGRWSNLRVEISTL
ncbi:MAG: OmpA family protein [Candidatus Eisenbacteria bacterium]